MTTVPNGNAHLAVLIDADNADASIIEPLLAEISKFGVASESRVLSWVPVPKAWPGSTRMRRPSPAPSGSHTGAIRKEPTENARKLSLKRAVQSTTRTSAGSTRALGMAAKARASSARETAPAGK